MRPVALRIEGFTCFKEPQELDLGELSLFALTGPTGAGKSSVLDAIIFALYGRAPRVGKGMSELVSLGRDRLSVVLDLVVAGERLRVMRKLRRGKPSEAMIELVVEGAAPKSIASGVRDVDAEVTRRLGLGYEAFTQAVVLPQGEFAKFLHSEPRERRKIMSDLLRLRVYEQMRSEAAERKKSLDAQVGALTRVLGDEYASATPEALAAARAALVVLETDVADARRGVTDARAAFDVTRGLRAKTVALEMAEQKLAAFAADEPTLLAGEAKLEAARRAAPVLPRIEAADDARRRHEEAERKEADARAEAEAGRVAFESAAARRVQADAAATQTATLREELRALDEAIGKLGPLDAARERLKRARADVLACDEQLLAELSHAEAAEREIADAKREAADRSRAIDEIGLDAARWERLDALRERATALAALRERAGASSSAEREAREAATKADEAEVAARDAWESARAAHGKLLGRVETYDDELREAERADVAAVLRKTLRTGEACPVCAQEVATVPPMPEATRVAELTSKRDAARREEEAARQRLERSGKTHAATESSARTAAEAKERAAAAARADASQVSAAERDLVEVAASDVETTAEPIEVRVLAAARKLADDRRRHDALEAAFQTATRRAAEAERKRAAAAASSAELRARRAQSQMLDEETCVEIASLERQIAEATGERDPVVARTATLEAIESLETRRDVARRDESDAQRAAQAASARHRECAQAAVAAATVRKTTAEEAERATKDAGFDDDSDVRAAALSRVALDELANVVARIREDRAQAELTVRALGAELAGRRVTAIEEAQAAETLHRCETRETESVRAHASRARDIDVMAERVARASKLGRELEEQSRSRNVYARLAGDLRSEKFQAFLMEEAFRDLASGASTRLQTLTSRYGLELLEDTFVVVDHDNAQERRSADTLSGGETFLASLALALELSAQVQRAAGAVALDSVFIDEGFGTLDPETLDTVAGALESLPTGGRMVGIITHLADLSARLPARVVVERGAAGSRLRVEL